MTSTEENRRYALSDELFRELNTLAARLEREFKSDGAFVPRVGRLYGENDAPRIMFIGKGTAGWGGSSLSLDDDWQATQRFYDKLYNKEYRSQFWDFIRNLTKGLFDRVGLDCEDDMRWALDRVVWSNLMKIGAKGSQPYGELADKQRPLMEKILHHELNTLRPNVIIICTNDYEEEFVESFFGLQDSKILAEVGGSEIYSIVSQEIGAKIYWTRHPERWGNRSEAERIIAEDFGNWYRQKPPGS